MDDDPLQRRLDAMEHRLSRIESALGLILPPRDRPDSPTTPAAPVSFPTETTVAPSAPPRPQASLERTIGLVWAGWVGAIAVAVAAGLGIKFAYDQGWFGLIGPATRLALLTALALVLIATGEVVYRRVSRLSAAGFFAAGVAVLFLAAYAGHVYYRLYGPGVAWGLMGGSSLIGAAIARRGDLVSIAVLSLIGGDLAPLLLGITPTTPGPFLGYLLMLQATALLLAAKLRPPLPEGDGTRARTLDGSAKWSAVRGVSLAGTAAWTFFALQLPTFLSWPGTLVFLLLAAVLYQAELLTTTARDASAAPAFGADFSLAVTAALTAGLLLYFRSSSLAVRSGSVLGLATTTGLLGASLRARAPKLRPLAIGFTVQAAALVAVAVPVALSGLWIAAVWAALAVAFAALDRRLNLPRAAALAVGVWLLAVGDCYVWTVGVAGSDYAAHTAVPWLSVWGRAVPAFVGMAVLLWITGHAVASLIDLPSGAVGPVAVLADAVLLLASFTGLPPLGATALVSLASLALGSVAIARAPTLLSHALTLWILAALNWLLLGTLLPRIWFGRPAADYLLLLNPLTTTAALLLASGALLARAARLAPLWMARLIPAGCVGVLLWTGSFEIDRFFARGAAGYSGDTAHAEQVALSVFWSVFAIAAVVAGFARGGAGLRYFGLGLFAVTGVKVVLVDLAQVSTGYRILSFLALGLLLLGTSVLYGRGGERVDGRKTGSS